MDQDSLKRPSGVPLAGGDGANRPPCFLNLEAKARLSEFGAFTTRVERDVVFKTIGKAVTRGEGIVTPVRTLDHVWSALDNPGVVGVIAPAEIAAEVPETLGLAVADQPGLAAYLIHEQLAARPDYFRNGARVIAEGAVIEPGAIIADRDVEIGPGAWICSGAVIRPGVRLGRDVKVGPCTVLGADAYEVASVSGRNRMWTSVGYVDVGDSVKFGSHDSVVSSAFFAQTRIGANTTFDNFVHVAHDCEIGENVRLTACSEVSGRVRIGDNAYLGPNCTISNGVTLGRDCAVTIGSTVTRSVPDGETVSGYFALPHEKFMRFFKSVMRNA
ncbi:MAG: DapH/DapD/GlmU-related protein [Oceanicaulis sp.]